MKKKWMFYTLLMVLTLFFQNCVSYLFGLGTEQLRILNRRTKIEAVLTDKETSLVEKEKLTLVLQAREFAIQELKLNEKGGFVYYTKLDRDQIGWNVSASLPLKFESYTWWFPIAGTVPYKGFFDKNSAEECEKELKEQGYDTKIRVTGGYSTLGWFSDPLFSPQLNYEKEHLVGLVFHEMAHATAYLPGDSTLNESYASFVEEKGVKLFFQSRGDQKAIQKQIREKETKLQSLDLLKEYASKLNQVYESNLDDKTKIESKQKIIEEFKETILKKGIINADQKQKFLNREWNNEDFMGAFRYHSFESGFESIWEESNSDFSKFHRLVQDTFSLSKEKRKERLERKPTNPKQD